MKKNQQQRSPSLHERLYSKYSSSQTYFYTNKINEIIKEKRTVVNILYQDVQYLLDMEQNLKRWYQGKEFHNKLFTFKEYYFYHEDCPRIFMKGLEETYAKWQDKKRDLVYKKLKLIYKQSDSSDDSQMDDQKSQNYVAMTHFLLQISDYNPFSKKYYLRVEAKSEKERKRIEDEKRHSSRRDLEGLNHELSGMLNDMSMLSDISTLSKNSPIRVEKDRQKGKARHFKQKSDDKSKSKSTNMSNSNSIVTFNFKKNKESVQKLKNLKDTKKLILKDVGKEKEMLIDAGKSSPKFVSNQGQNNFLKSKSIFSVSSFGALNKNIDLKFTQARNQPFKVNYNKKLTLEDRKYETQKKKGSLPKNIIIKTKSTSKLDPRTSVDKVASRESSVGRMPRADQFSDKKLSKNNQFDIRSRSIKSEFVSSSKKPILNVRAPLQLGKGKRLLQLRNW